MVRAQHPRRRRRAVRRRHRGRADDLVQRRGGDRGRPAVVAARATPEAASRSTACGSTSTPSNGRRGSRTSACTPSQPASRHVSTKLALPDPPPDASRTPWPLRVTDVDLHGHVNNAVHWQAVEHVLPVTGRLRAELDYRQPIDLGDELRARGVRQLRRARDGRCRQGRRPRHAYLSRSFSRRPSAMARPTTVITARYATWPSVAQPTVPSVSARRSSTPWYSGVSGTIHCAAGG